ncbi:MAG: hypothetical protein WA061_02805 [Microgenomates group bacterium]
MECDITDLEFYVECDDCGSRLKIRNQSLDGVNIHLMVDKCRECCDNSYEDGKSQGYDEGHDDGFHEGSTEGYDEGYSAAQNN